MNELYRTTCRASVGGFWRELSGALLKRTFIFYDDRFEIYDKHQKCVMTIAYKDIAHMDCAPKRNLILLEYNRNTASQITAWFHFICMNSEDMEIIQKIISQKGD